MNPSIASQYQNQIARAIEPDTNTSAVPQHLVDKFQAMLAQGTPAVPETNATNHSNVVAKAVEEQASYDKAVPNDVMYMTQHASALSMQRLVAASMTVELEMASMNADMQVKMGAVQSSQNAIQTLIKNQ